VAASKVEPFGLIGMRRPSAKRKDVADSSAVYAPLDERSHGHHLKLCGLTPFEGAHLAGIGVGADAGIGHALISVTYNSQFNI
jgi:hypothetical protein